MRSTRQRATTPQGRTRTQTEEGTVGSAPEAAAGDVSEWSWTSVGVVVRTIGSLLERLVVTDTLKDNPRVVSPHMCVESTPNHTRRQVIPRSLSYESSA